MATSTKGNSAQFTYDFGIAIAQSTITKITRLAGVTFTLASAFNALKTTATNYVSTIRENTLRLGGVQNALLAIEQAQNRIIKGQSFFNVDDQLRGIERLRAAGIDVGKNMEWISKSAHATGKSYEQFAGMIASAISGNAGALVDAGLMTQRATRMFDKFQANTIQRRDAILNFVKNHRVVIDAIKNDFVTIQDQMQRIATIRSRFVQSIIGKPNDPNSFYGQIVQSLTYVADSMAKNKARLQMYGEAIGRVLGWVVKQVAHFVVWVGRQVNQVIGGTSKVTDDFGDKVKSMVVWLEFWKRRVVNFFKEYGGAIKSIIKWVLVFKALKTTFIIGRMAIASVIGYSKALKNAIALQKAYMAFQGPIKGAWLQSWAVFMPRTLRKLWVSVGKHIGKFIFVWIPRLVAAFKTAAVTIAGAFTAANPIGWIVLAIAAVVSGVVVMYKKFEWFRAFINGLFRMVGSALKLIWNLAMLFISYVIISVKGIFRAVSLLLKTIWKGIKAIGGFLSEYVFGPIGSFFSTIGGFISSMWDKFMDTRVGKWISEYIVSPIKQVFEWLGSIWDKFKAFFSKLNINTAVSNLVKDASSDVGFNLPTFESHSWGGDTRDYLKFGGKTPAVTAPANPLVKAPAPEKIEEVGSSTLNFNEGAIKIVVEKGENINETLLAEKIRKVIRDVQREGNIRGGQ